MEHRKKEPLSKAVLEKAIRGGSPKGISMTSDYALLAGLCGFGLLVGMGASLTGMGGGFMIVPFLLALGYTPQQVVGTSFAAMLMIAISAVAAHGREGGVDYRAGLLLGMGGVIGAQFGARILSEVSPTGFKRVFACVLIAVAVWMLARK